jgi:CRP-like cAMP-binding protein
MEQVIIDKLEQHFQKGKVKRYAKGTVLIFANEEPEGVSLLVNGLVEQYDITKEGNKLTVNVFKPPAFFPMSWAINKTPNTYFYAALSDVVLLLADADQTVSFLKANPDVMFNLLSRVYKGTDGLLRRLVVAASGIAASRLIFELLIEAYRFGTDTGEGMRTVKIKQSVLSSRSGLARETVSRELHKLEEEKLITRSDQGITIQLSKLEEKLDFNF